MFYLTPHSTSVWTIKSDLTNRGFQTFKELFWRRLMRLIFQPSLTFVWEQWNLKYLKQTRGTHKKIVGKAKLAIEQTRTDESPTLLSPPLFSSFLPWSLPWNNLIFSWCCRRILWTASIKPTNQRERRLYCQISQKNTWKKLCLSWFGSQTRWGGGMPGSLK